MTTTDLYYISCSENLLVLTLPTVQEDLPVKRISLLPTTLSLAKKMLKLFYSFLGSGTSRRYHRKIVPVTFL
jgi:hypothetical protein